MSEMPAEIAKAFVAFQANITDLKHDKEGQRSSYASVGSMMTHVRSAAKDQGLAISMPMAWSEGAGFFIKPVIAHSSGESWSPDHLAWPIIVDDMTNCQKIGSAVSYARRYLLQSILGLASGIEEDDFDTDDDGLANGGLLDPPKQDQWTAWADQAITNINTIENADILVQWDKAESDNQDQCHLIAPEQLERVQQAYLARREKLNG
jgi:hypothetical protein